MLKPKRAVLPFTKGVDRGGNDPRVTADLLVAQNCVFERNGAVSKRNGRSLLSGAQTDDNLGEHNGRPVIYGSSLKKLNGDTLPGGTFDELDDQLNFVDINSEVIRAYGDQQAHAMICPEVVNIGDTRVASYVYNSLTRIESVDHRSGKRIKLLDSGNMAAESNTRLIKLTGIDTYCYFLYVNSSFQLILQPVGADGEILIGDAINLVTAHTWPLLQDSTPFDVCQMATDMIGVVYKERGADDLVVGWVQMSGASVAAEGVNQRASANLRYQACCSFTDGEMFVSWYQEQAGDREIWGAVYNDDDPPTQEVSEVELDAWAAGDTIGSMAAVTAETDQVEVYWVKADAGTPWHSQLYRHLFTNAAGTGTKDSTHTIGGDCTIWCKPFLDSNSRLFIGLHLSYDTGNAEDPQKLLVLLEDPRGTGWPMPVGKWLVNVAAHLDLRGAKSVYETHVCTPQSLGSDQFLVAGLELGEEHYSQSYLAKSMLHAITIDTTAPVVTDINSLRELVLPNSAPMVFDGNRVFEQQFLIYPPKPKLVASGAGSGFGAGLWTYAALIEVTDTDGNVWRSPLGIVETVTTTNEDTVTITLPTVKTTRLHAVSVTLNVQLVLYRSETAGDTWLRRLKTWSNVPTDDTVTYADNGDDVSGNEQEYTRYGRVAGNHQPPPYRIATIWKNRIVVAHRQFEDRWLFYSKEFVEGEGHGFPLGHWIAVPPEGGAITALAGLADKLIILKRRRLLFTHGNGYDRTGAGENYADPILISEGIGCIDQRSVIGTPVGVFFLADDGINLLDRSLAIKPVGRRVKGITDGCNITRAVQMPADNHVLFFTDDGTEDVLVYNYLFDRWTMWRNWDAKDAVVVDGKLYTKPGGTDQVAYLDAATNYDESTTFVPMRVRISPISLAGLFSSKRLWETWLLAYIEKQTITIRIAYEGDPVWTDELTFDGTDLESATLEQYINQDTYYEDDYYSSAEFGDKAGMLRWRGSRTRIEDCIQIEIEDSA